MQHYTLILIFKFKCCIENQEFVIVKKKLILVFLLCMFCMHQSTSEYFQTNSEENKWKNYFKLTSICSVGRFATTDCLVGKKIPNQEKKTVTDYAIVILNLI